MTAKLQPDQYRQPYESAVQWANRLRVQRGADGVVWVERPDGGLTLRSATAIQSKLEF